MNGDKKSLFPRRKRFETLFIRINSIQFNTHVRSCILSVLVNQFCDTKQIYLFIIIIITSRFENGFLFYKII